MSNNPIDEAKNQLDYIISIQRSAFYKPTQIAEILYRVNREVDGEEQKPLSLENLKDLETYRVISRKWRDKVSERLIGNVSTSSARYQDDLFNENAMPPRLLYALGQENCNFPHVVERYIYQAFWSRLSAIHSIYHYIMERHTAYNNFYLEEMLDYFDTDQLRTSIDKAFEIVVYALFYTLLEVMNVKVSFSLDEANIPILEEFEEFAKKVLGITPDKPELTWDASFFRPGTTNAADQGVDIMSNFGPAVQVKHIDLKQRWVESAVEKTRTDKTIIVCKSADRDIIKTLLSQMGIKIRGIVTQNDLFEWYEKACRGEFSETVGPTLMRYIVLEFDNEFPSLARFQNFYKERDYDELSYKKTVFWRQDPWLS